MSLEVKVRVSGEQGECVEVKMRYVEVNVSVWRSR